MYVFFYQQWNVSANGVGKQKDCARNVSEKKHLGTADFVFKKDHFVYSPKHFCKARGEGEKGASC